MNISKNKWYNFFLFKGSGVMVTLLFICLAASAYLGAMTPGLISNLSRNYDSDSLFQTSIVALLINFLVVYINRVIYQLAVNKYVRMLVQYARTETYGRWLSSHELDSEKYPQGEILSRIMSDTESIRDLISSGSFGIFIDLCFVVSCLIGFITLQKFTGFFIAGSEVVATILLIWGSQLMRDMFMRLRNSQAQVNRVTANVLGGFQQIFYTRHDQYASRKSEVAFLDFLEKQNTVNTMDAAYYAVAESLYPILLALVIFIFPYSHLTEVALIFAIVDLIQRSINPIKEISGKIANIQRAATGIDRIQNFLNDIPHRINTTSLNDSKNTPFLQMKVDLDYFEYPKRAGAAEGSERENFSLEDIHFEGHPGELIGIVGLSGCGKSTLLNILAGNILAPKANVKLVMGTPQNSFELHLRDLDEYRKEVSIVSQESHIFSESLMFNITLKRVEPEDFAENWNFLIENIPYLKSWGLAPHDQVVPSSLSLGQRQLLAGVRACYIKKNIVFFDEISSALDSDLEFALRKLVLLIQKFSLTIIVAHRVETIIGADQILVMDKGRVIDSGKHSVLIQRSIVYQDFIRELSHS
ncbi:MAG: ABC transporter ATP-binding protein [Bacteriovorax sp.]|nr:ABC transporter ATP-binding protein [Bacteriovorax sp.]